MQQISIRKGYHDRQRCLSCNIDLSLARLTIPTPMNSLVIKEQIHLMYRSLHQVHRIDRVRCHHSNTSIMKYIESVLAPPLLSAMPSSAARHSPPNIFIQSIFRSVSSHYSTSNEFERKTLPSYHECRDPKIQYHNFLDKLHNHKHQLH